MFPSSQTGNNISPKTQREKSGFNEHCSSGRQLKIKEQIKVKGSICICKGRAGNMGQVGEFVPWAALLEGINSSQVTTLFFSMREWKEVNSDIYNICICML